MLQAGIVKVDERSLGIEAGVHARVIAGDGHIFDSLRVIGTLLRGVLWECSALPEIRMLAARIARELPVEPRQRRSGKSRIERRH
jgi:uncharacterized NAD(P)/FAD-binding protein YdhS